jgi:hypothetical protein
MASSRQAPDGSDRTARNTPAARRAATAADVDQEQRRRLIECCAFFRAQHFRETAPGQYRADDVRAAAHDVDRAIRPVRRKKKD